MVTVTLDVTKAALQ